MKVLGWGALGGWSPAHPPPVAKFPNRDLYSSASLWMPFLHSKAQYMLMEALSTKLFFFWRRTMYAAVQEAPSPLRLHTHSCSSLAKKLSVLKVKVRPWVTFLPFFASSEGLYFVFSIPFQKEPSQGSFQSPLPSPRRWHLSILSLLTCSSRMETAIGWGVG